jgi:Cu/Ag efflux pump CusA
MAFYPCPVRIGLKWYITFSLIGILPTHFAMGAFFTATSMIGFIAGAGIVVRNSIILVFMNTGKIWMRTSRTSSGG